MGAIGTKTIAIGGVAEQFHERQSIVRYFTGKFMRKMAEKSDFQQFRGSGKGAEFGTFLHSRPDLRSAERNRSERISKYSIVD